MLTVRPKISELTFRLFGRSLHPELFEIFASRKIERKQYQLDVAVTSSGHVFTWTNGDVILAEASASILQPFPTQRQIFSHPLVGQHEEELEWQNRVCYQNSFQLEPADPKRFAAIQNQLLEASEYEGLVYQFQASGRLAFGGVSYVDIQSRERSVKLRAFHTFPDAYVVVKSETSFTVIQ